VTGVNTVTVGLLTGAEFELVWISGVTAAISCIVSAGAIVIASITNTVASPIRGLAFRVAHQLFGLVLLVIGIQTLAVFAELLLIRIPGIAAAITVIPSTTAVVVVIVADSVASPVRLPALCVANLLQGI